MQTPYTGESQRPHINDRFRDGKGKQGVKDILSYGWGEAPWGFRRSWQG